MSATMKVAAMANNLGSAVGSPLAQLLKRPEIVMEDLVEVVREKYPEYFAEIAQLSGRLQGDTARHDHACSSTLSSRDPSRPAMR
jgi:hypothetical protein